MLAAPMTRVALALSLLLFAAPSSAEPRDPIRVREEGTAAPRIMGGIGLGGFAEVGQGVGRGGPALVVSMPLFVGQRRRIFQWAYSLDSEGVWDHSARVGMIALGGTVQGRVHLGRIYAIHFGLGPMLSAQLGVRRSLGLMPMNFVIENAFRPFEDDRQRIVVGFRLGPGLWFKSSPGNDAPFGGGAIVYAGYETPL
jgi:hypothetical protein